MPHSSRYLLRALVLFACFLAVHCQWTPNVPLAWSANYKATMPAVSPEPFPGRMWSDFDNDFLRTDMAAFGLEVSQVHRNSTNFMAMTNQTCVMNYAPFFLSPFWWTSSSTPSGFDPVYKCNRFTFTIPTIVHLTGCFYDPQTPAYMNTTVTVADPPVNMMIAFSNWRNGYQSPSIFTVPAGCHLPSASSRSTSTTTTTTSSSSLSSAEEEKKAKTVFQALLRLTSKAALTHFN